MKRNLLPLYLLLSTSILKAQVNMTEGTMNLSVPGYSYVDKLSKLNFSIDFVYNSGNGLIVDQISNCIGTNWNLSGMPIVTRSVNGLPDDQLEKVGDIFDLTKYPPGYLYNNKPISSGCPTALAKYPIFTGQGVWVDPSNITQADRELDEFQFSLNRSSGTFVIDKNFNAIQLGDTRVKIEIFTEDQTASKNIRTSIKEFHITDVDGLKYIFSEQETNKVFRVSEHNPNGSWIPGEIFSKSYDLSTAENPFVTSAWHISKILDTKTNRFILFTYTTETNQYEIRGQLQAEVFNQEPPSQVYMYGSGLNEVQGTTPDNQAYTVWAYNIKGTILKKEIQKKQISSIVFPDGGYMSFNYQTNRKDVSGTKMLDKVDIYDLNQTAVLKFNLSHSYFVKNEIKDPSTTEENKWARLCLTEIKKIGSTTGVDEAPWKFEYYTGTNSTEDFVPPYFFHAKDQWGYYNGSYSGVSTTNFLDDLDKYSWAKVCIYNQPHGIPGGIELFYTAKTGYAKNGLLKAIINPFGGKTEYQYEQNYFKPGSTAQFYSYDYDPSGSGYAVGGVRLSKTIVKQNAQPTNDLITEYIYTDEQGNSTRWGEEPLKFQLTHRSFWQAEDMYFNGLECKYHYLYPGRTISTSSSGDDFKLFQTLATQGGKLIGTANQFKSKYSDIIKPNLKRMSGLNIEKAKTLRLVQLKSAMGNTAINLVLQYIIGVVISCSITPQKLDARTITYNNSINTNFLPALYKKVTKLEYSGGGLQSGKTVFEFTSPEDFPLILPNESSGFDQKVRGYYWIYGLPKSEKYYNNMSALVKSTENEYELKKNDITNINTRSCNCETFWQQSLRSDQWNTAPTFDEFTDVNTTNSYGVKQKVDFYNIVTGHSELKKTTEKVFNQANVPFTTIVNYYYDPVNNLLSSQVSTDSKGNTIETKNYYIEDYNLSNPSHSVLNQMKNDNILDVPVSSETWMTKPGGTPEMLSASVTEFGIAPNGDYRPVKLHSLETDRPVPQNTIGIFDPNQLIRNNSIIKLQTENYYDSYGNQIGIKDVNGNRTEYTLFGYDNLLPVATISQAPINEVAYTSFERTNNQGNPFVWNWVSTPVSILDYGSPTGRYYTTEEIHTDLISYKNKPYILSFWARGGSFIVSPAIMLTQKIAGPEFNGWKYYEYEVSPTNSYYILSLNGNGQGIDEVRLYPKGATMATVTYNIDFGKSSECDINNRILYYEYDELGRIAKVLDERHNIIKTYEYHFKN